MARVIEVPRPQPWRAYLPSLWFAVIWTAGFVSMIVGEPPENSGGSWFLVLWAAIGVGAGAAAVWKLRHHEEIRVDAQQLTHVRVLGPVRRARSFDREQITNVRVSRDTPSFFDPRASFALNGFAGGVIAFDYGRYTVRLGDVEEEEATRVVAALAEEGVR